jgi:membrane protease YdiL (CAAX protease family)
VPFDPEAFEKRIVEKLHDRPDLLRLRAIEAAVTWAIALLGLALFVRRAFARRAPEAAGPPERPRWGCPELFALALAFAAMPALALALAGRLGVPPLQPGAEPRFEHLVAQVAANAAVAGIAAALVLLRGQRLRALGLHGERAAPAVRAGLGAFVMVFPLFYGMERLSVLLFEKLHVARSINPAAALLLAGDGAAEIATVAVLAVVIAPVTEEVVFRGVLYPVARERLGLPGGVVATAALFAAVHPLVDWLPLFVFAIGLALVYERRGSLLAPITMHAANNALGVAILMIERHIARA